MRIGFLHLGDPSHGVSRYGRILAAECRRRGGEAAVELREVEADFSNHRPSGTSEPTRAAAAFDGCDVVHLQFNRALFGDGPAQRANLREFFARCSPPIVANLHDVYLDDPWAGWRKRTGGIARRLDRLRHFFAATLPTRAAVAYLVKNAARTIVCFEYEKLRLAGLKGVERTRVVPHFVEERLALPSREAARASLGIGAERVVAVLGYIHRRKGHDLVVDALPLLPRDVRVVFIGAPPSGVLEHEEYLRQLRRKAERQGVGDRLTVTGYVDEATLDRWLVATDLAVCPFRFFSASGSLATWISAERPILCHALPQIAEYRARAPEAIDTFDRFTPKDLADAITRSLGRGDATSVREALTHLRTEFSVFSVTERTLEVYREALVANRK